MVLYWITWFDADLNSLGSVDELAHSAEELHKKYKVTDYKNAVEMTICVAD